MANMVFVFLSCALLLTFSAPQGRLYAEAANILGIFTSHSPSHVIIHMSIMRILAEEGHNVTVVAIAQPKVTHERIKTIIIPPTPQQQRHLAEMMGNLSDQKSGPLDMLWGFFSRFHTMFDMQVDVLRSERFKQLYDTANFDLVFVGYFFNEYQLGVARKFNCPVIVSWPLQPLEMVNKFVGNPNELSYVPGMLIAQKPGQRMTWLQKLINVTWSVVFGSILKIMDLRNRNYYNELFPAGKDNFPTYAEMNKNVSLVFCNSYGIAEGPIRPNVPAIVEIGGIQVKETADKLPEQMESFLSANTEHGAILFSLGSNVKSATLKPETIQIIYDTLSSLKQNVLWKWEDLQNTPGNASNILYSKWVPQDDVLAHPNLKLFITHAGKGSIIESQYHGVPMVALPVFGDQPTNAAQMTDAGYGLHLDLFGLKKQEFRDSIDEVLNNPYYRKNVQQFSQLYRDRPLTARQSVIYWTEYVLRHKGAAHMQSPLVHLSFWESNNLDILAIYAVILYIFWKLFSITLYFVVNKLFGKRIAKKLKEQ